MSQPNSATPAASTDATTPAKQSTGGSPPKPDPKAAAAANANAGEGGKSLNVNAKSFVPRTDTSHETPSNASRAHGVPPHVPPAVMAPLGMPVPPPGVPPFMPPMLGVMPMPMMVPPPMIPPGFVAPGARVPPPVMPLNPVAAAAVPPPGISSPSMGRGVPMAPGFVTTSPLIPPPPLTLAPSAAVAPGTPSHGPATPLSGGGPAQVSVGNATLAQKRSTVPPKPGCVLLAGITAVGKTTVGRQLVTELNDDKLGWEFFSGADFIKETANAKPTNWETTKSVFDGLNEFLDKILARQSTNPVRGILIDKQLRGVEDIYYLTQLLRSKGLLLWGVIGMDCNSDDILVQRLGNSPGAIEKIKYHRVIYSRIVEAAKHVGIWRTVDAGVPKADAVRMLRTMVLGCSSQSPTKQFHSNVYHDSTLPMVDNYATYFDVMNSLFTVIPRNAKGVAAFPGFVGYTPLPTSMLDPKKQPLKEFAVRRKLDGAKYVLFFNGTKLYLIPRHMRCVFEVSSDAWLGVHLTNTGRFVVDGDLVKVKERGKEKFVVYDILFWAEKGSGTNTVARSTWKERQDKLKTNLCAESTAFFPKKGDLVVVHQTICDDHRGISTLLNDNSCDYPSDGLVFHSTSIIRKDDPTYVWRPPESVTADFRLGAPLATTAKDATTRTFPLEVFDQKLARYVQYRQDTTDIAVARSSAVEGAIVTCNMDATTNSPGTTHTWSFSKVRTDLQIAMYKAHVDELLKDCIIPKQVLLDYINAVDAKNPHTAPAGKQPQLGVEKQPAPPVVMATPAATAPAATTGAKAPTSRQAFGSALAGPEGLPPDFKEKTSKEPTLRDVVAGDHKRSTTTPSRDGDLVTDAQMLSAVVSNVKVKAVESNQSDFQALQAMVGSVSVVSSDPNIREESRERRRREDNREPRSCVQCKGQTRGRVDKRDNKFYCYDCWAREGVEFCDECDDFASGRHDNSSRKKPFYCDKCWEKYERKGSSKESRGGRGGERSASAAEDDADKDNGRSRRGGRSSKDRQGSDSAEPAQQEENKAKTEGEEQGGEGEDDKKSRRRGGRREGSKGKSPSPQATEEVPPVTA